MKKVLGALLAVLLVYVASPYAALALLWRAASQSDEEALASRVDFDSLRTSLSEQVEARMVAPGETVDPMQRMMVRTLINGFASPRGVATLVRNGGRMSLGSPPVDTPGPGTESPTETPRTRRFNMDDLDLRWLFFTGPTRFEFQSRMGTVILEPRGAWWRLVDWKLPELRQSRDEAPPQTPPGLEPRPPVRDSAARRSSAARRTERGFPA